MTSKTGFKVIAVVLTTAIFGYLGYILWNSIVSGKLFLNNDDSFTTEAIIIFVPFVASIIWGWIRHRAIWIGSLLCMMGCAGINKILGENTTPKHIPLFVVSIAIPYLLCLFAILKEEGPEPPDSTDRRDPVCDMTGEEDGVDITWMAD